MLCARAGKAHGHCTVTCADDHEARARRDRAGRLSSGIWSISAITAVSVSISAYAIVILASTLSAPVPDSVRVRHSRTKRLTLQCPFRPGDRDRAREKRKRLARRESVRCTSMEVM